MFAWVEANSGLIGLASLVVAVVAGYFGWRALSQPKVAISWTMSRLNRPSDQIRMYANGQELFDPHLLRVEVLQSGLRDLTADNFAANLTIRFSGAPVVSGEIRREGPSAAGGRCHLSSSELVVEPCVLHRGNVLVFEAIADGEPTLTVRNPFQHAGFRLSGQTATTTGENARFWPLVAAYVGMIAAMLVVMDQHLRGAQIDMLQEFDPAVDFAYVWAGAIAGVLMGLPVFAVIAAVLEILVALALWLWRWLKA
jgi:hypothetical protein